MVYGFILKDGLPSLWEVFAKIGSQRNYARIACLFHPGFKWLPDYDDQTVELIRSTEKQEGGFSIWPASTFISAMPKMAISQNLVFFFNEEPADDQIDFKFQTWEWAYHEYDGYEVELFTKDKDIAETIAKKFKAEPTEFPGRILSGFNIEV